MGIAILFCLLGVVKGRRSSVKNSRKYDAKRCAIYADCIQGGCEDDKCAYNNWDGVDLTRNKVGPRWRTCEKKKWPKWKKKFDDCCLGIDEEDKETVAYECVENARKLQETEDKNKTKLQNRCGYWRKMQELVDSDHSRTCPSSTGADTIPTDPPAVPADTTERPTTKAKPTSEDDSGVSTDAVTIDSGTTDPLDSNSTQMADPKVLKDIDFDEILNSWVFRVLAGCGFFCLTCYVVSALKLCASPTKTPMKNTKELDNSDGLDPEAVVFRNSKKETPPAISDEAVSRTSNRSKVSQVCPPPPIPVVRKTRRKSESSSSSSSSSSSDCSSAPVDSV